MRVCPRVFAVAAFASTAAFAQVGASPTRGTLAVFDPVGGAATIRVEGSKEATISVEEQAAFSFGDLLRDEFRKEGYDVLPRAKMGTGTCSDEVCAAEKGLKLGVAQAVVTRLSRLERKVVVTATLVETTSGKVLFNDRATAASLDDLDTLSTRVAQAVARRVPIDTTVTAHTVTDQEAKDQNRRKAVFTTGLRLDGFVPFTGYGDTRFMYGGEWVNYYEVKDLAIEAAFGGRVSDSDDSESSAAEWFVDLGGYYFLSQADTSPFVGGGVGLHGVSARFKGTSDGDPTTDDFESDADQGPGAWVGVGVMFLRTADVHVTAGAKYQLLSTEIDGELSNGVMVGLTVTYTKRGNGGCCLW